jgi:hypothetical protein
MTEGSRASPSYCQALVARLSPERAAGRAGITRCIADRGYLARALLEKSIEKQVLVCPGGRLPDASRSVSVRIRIDARKWLSQKAKHNPQLEWMADGE